MGVTVLIADDHAGFRSWARALLQVDGYEVIGEVPDGGSVLSAVRHLKPQVVLLDIQLPDISGLDVAGQLLQDPDAPIVILTSSRDASDYGHHVRTCGAAGFVPKGELSGAALAALLEAR